MTVATEPEPKKTIPPWEDNERDRVARWVEEMLVELGAGEALSSAVAYSGIDWHRVKKLVEDGCDPALAVEICM